MHYILLLCLDSESPPPTPPPGDGICLPGWWPYGHYCYFVYNGKQGFSWPEAQHYCRLVNGADLASVHSRAEANFLLSINYTRYHNVWLGLTRDGSCTCPSENNDFPKINPSCRTLLSNLTLFGSAFFPLCNISKTLILVLITSHLGYYEAVYTKVSRLQGVQN